MPEYIERGRAKTAIGLEGDKWKIGEADGLAGLYEAARVISELPADDVELVRHGRWVKVAWVPCDEADGGYWIVRCSQCSIPHDKESRYCPNCGAKMDVEVGE